MLACFAAMCFLYFLEPFLCGLLPSEVKLGLAFQLDCCADAAALTSAEVVPAPAISFLPFAVLFSV